MSASGCPRVDTWSSPGGWPETRCGSCGALVASEGCPRAEPPYDSRPDTHEHIANVRGLLTGAAVELLERAHRHDRSKLDQPELDGFDEWSPKLAELEYGSEEYREALRGLGAVLEHHYAVNDHHPEHAPGGVGAMDLIQLLEMLCDWIAAGRRHDPPSDPLESIDKNAERFGYGPEVRQLLRNSVDRLREREAAL